MWADGKLIVDLSESAQQGRTWRYGEHIYRFHRGTETQASAATPSIPAMVRRWHADPFGFLRPGGEVPALIGSAPLSTPPSTGTGVVVCIMW